MYYHIRIYATLLFSLWFTSACLCQGSIENTDEAKITANWLRLTYNDVPRPVLKLPKRKNDSPFFCDELIPYKGGYIINSITSNKSGRNIEVSTAFYYIDPATKNLSTLIFPGVDTIESIVNDGHNGLYCSYQQGGARIISFLFDGVEKNIATAAPAEIKTSLDTAKWLKLGFSNNSLYILSANNLFLYANNQWAHLTRYSLDDFYLKVLKYRRSSSILPTRNLVISGGYVWFLQEIVQQRSSLLFKLNIKTGELSNFFTSLDYTDSYFKQVNDFSVLQDSSLLVCASRLIGNSLVINVAEQKPAVWIFNNKINTGSGNGPQVTASTAAQYGDTIYLAGTNGLFEKRKDSVIPLALFENTHQEVKEKDGLVDFEFVPRNLIKLPGQQFLVGGMWGGLYLIDVIQRRISCLDDTPDEKVKTIDIRKL